MLELLALLLSTSASVFKSTERLEAKNLVVPIENLILYDQRGFLKGPVSVPDRRFFFAAGTRRDFGVIAKDSAGRRVRNPARQFHAAGELTARRAPPARKPMV
jgi:hypothetical protein